MKTENNTTTLRLFVALPIPEEIGHYLLKLQNTLKKRNFNFKVSWARLESLHLTMNFLGERQCGEVEQIIRAVISAACTHDKFSISAGGVGVFPAVKRARVLWAGVRGDVEGLLSLQKNLTKHLAKAGVKPERKRYSPHLTLAQIKGQAPPLEMVKVIREFQKGESQTFIVRTVNLYRSDLRSTGAVHTLLCRTDLR